MGLAAATLALFQQHAASEDIDLFVQPAGNPGVAERAADGGQHRQLVGAVQQRNRGARHLQQPGSQHGRQRQISCRRHVRHRDRQRRFQYQRRLRARGDPRDQEPQQGTVCGDVRRARLEQGQGQLRCGRSVHGRGVSLFRGRPRAGNNKNKTDYTEQHRRGCLDCSTRQRAQRAITRERAAAAAISARSRSAPAATTSSSTSATDRTRKSAPTHAATPWLAAAGWQTPRLPISPSGSANPSRRMGAIHAESMGRHGLLRWTSTSVRPARVPAGPRC